MINLEGDPEGPETHTAVCAWSGRDAGRTIFGYLTEGGETFRAGYNDEGLNVTGPFLGPDGRFVGQRRDYEPGTGTSASHIWTLAGDPLVLSSVPAPSLGDPFTPHKISGFGTDGIMWGQKARTEANAPLKGIVFAPQELQELPFVPKNVIRHVSPNDKTSVFALSGGTEPGQVHHDNNWQLARTYRDAIDIAGDGVAIGKNIPKVGSPKDSYYEPDKIAPILQNGQWQSIGRIAPGIPAAWRDATTRLLDISPSGWILGQRGEGSESGASVLLPLRVQGAYQTTTLDGEGNPVATTFTEAVGVDAFSISSSTPDDGPGDPTVHDRIWIMAPLGGPDKSITISAPLNDKTPLTLTAPGIKFGNADQAILTGPSNPLTIRAAPGSTSGSDIVANLTLGNGQTTANSISQPIGFKVMKTRTAKVIIYKMAKIRSSGNSEPINISVDEAEIEKHLNDLFGPQINVRFDVTLHPDDIPVNWDTNSDGFLNDAGPNNHSDDQNAVIAAARLEYPLPNLAPNIEVFIISSGTQLASDGGAVGLTNRLARTCWALGTRKGKYWTSQDLYDTIGHEIGHVFFDYGHPYEGSLPLNNPDAKGVSPLPRADHSKRLMAEGNGSTSESRMTVKREWDEAEKWLVPEEILRPMTP